jgi:diguanylate cyclase (GGDEF)-like protein
MKILLVEDDTLIAQPLAIALTEQHYVVDCAKDGQAGWELLESFDYDLILLDVQLPKLDGITLCRRLRSQGKQTPILLLTALEATTHKVVGLDAGADDYLTKPFEFPELLARIRALLRRGSSALPPILTWGNLHLDPSSCAVTCDQEVLHLTPKEYGLLELFLRNPNRIFSCSALIDHQWALEDPPTDETVRSHLKGLRQKLKTAGMSEDPIETVYGIGYRLKSVSPESSSPENNHPSGDAPDRRAMEAPGSLPELAGMTEIWQQVQEKLKERVAVLEAATKALLKGGLSDTLRQQAEQEAHKLVGSLGMFGAEEGSQLAQRIEEQLQTLDGSDRRSAQALSRGVKNLRRSLHKLSTNAPPEILPTPNEYFPQQPLAKIMVVDDDRNILTALQNLLTPWGFQLALLCDAHQFLERLEENEPDLLILDIKMPHRRGLELCQLVRNDPRWHKLPILFMTAQANLKTLQQVYEAGADDYVRKPIAGPELITRVLNCLERSRLLKNLAEVDTLTRVANRQQSTQALLALLQESDRTQTPLWLAIVALDNLKQLNRQYGHAAGDQVLSRLGDLLRQTFQHGAVLGRWGGTEFVIGRLGNTVKAGVKQLSEISKQLQEIEFTGLKNRCFHPTFSAAVVGYPQDGEDLEALYWSADVILQQAKLAGGDRILSPLPLSSVQATSVRGTP